MTPANASTDTKVMLDANGGTVTAASLSADPYFVPSIMYDPVTCATGSGYLALSL